MSHYFLILLIFEEHSRVRGQEEIIKKSRFNEFETA